MLPPISATGASSRTLFESTRSLRVTHVTHMQQVRNILFDLFPVLKQGTHQYGHLGLVTGALQLSHHLQRSCTLSQTDTRKHIKTTGLVETE